VIKLIELEEIKDNPVMSKTIKKMIMFNKNLIEFEPEKATEIMHKLSPSEKVYYHLEEAR